MYIWFIHLFTFLPGAVQSRYHTINLHQTTHNLPPYRPSGSIRYGMYFVSLKFNWCSASIITKLYAISSYLNYIQRGRLSTKPWPQPVVTQQAFQEHNRFQIKSPGGFITDRE